jgi:hypothetical protein
MSTTTAVRLASQADPGPSASFRSKRPRIAPPGQSEFEHNSLGLRPLGNLLLEHRRNARHDGLGNLQLLPDELVSQIFAELEPRELVRTQATSRAFFAFCVGVEALWKIALLQVFFPLCILFTQTG